MRQEPCVIPEECRLHLWAETIIAKDVQCNEAILGEFDPYGEPVPYELLVTGLNPGEEVLCVEDFKIVRVAWGWNFICANRVRVLLAWDGYLWLRTTEGFRCASDNFSFEKEIPVCSFVKADGTNLTPSEFSAEADQAEIINQNYQLIYVNVLPVDPYEPTQQVVEVIVTGDIITKLGKFKDVVVYGYEDPTICPPLPFDPCLNGNDPGTNQ